MSSSTAQNSISSDALTLAEGAARIIEQRPHEATAAVLVDRMHIAEQHRGHKISAHLLGELMGLLHLDPACTLMVAMPEPQQESGGYYEDGPERDRALARLKAACRIAGFSPIPETDVWVHNGNQWLEASDAQTDTP